MFERYTDKARRTIFFARYEATQSGSETILPGHLLLGLFREDRKLASRFPFDAIDAFRAGLGVPGAKKIALSTDLPLSDPTKRVLSFGAEEAERLNHTQIGPEHLALGILREDDDTAARFLKSHGATLEQLRQSVTEPVADSGTAMNSMEMLKRVIGRIGSSTFQRTGDQREGRFSATRVEAGVRTVVSHNFVQGQEIRVTESMNLTADGKTLHYTIEIQGPGQQHRHEIDFPLAP